MILQAQVIQEGSGAMANVTGFDPAVSGQEPKDESGNTVPVGVWGDSNTDVGVFGTSGAVPPGGNILIASMLKAGVIGHGTDRPGIIGHSETACGVCGFSEKFSGVYAYSTNPDSDPTVASILGIAGSAGIAVLGSGGDGEGVVGEAGTGAGVRGSSWAGTAVLGEGFAGRGDGTPYGVIGLSDKGVGIHGESQTANAIEGVTYGDGYAVQGVHFSKDSGGGVLGESVLGNGVEGFTFSTDPSTGAVYGRSAGGNAGLFIGNVKVTGSITKGGGGFRIDHPDDPKNRALSHSFVESPEMMNVYSGTVKTDKRGKARVSLPKYFEALNRDFRYQLTAIGQFAKLMVSKEIRNNEFTIESDPPKVKVCWQVTGVRRDAWAEANRIPVEEEKPVGEKGNYLHPELFKKKVTRDSRPVAAMAAVLPDQIRRHAAEVLAQPGRPGFGDVVDEAGKNFAQRVTERRESARTK
jgi:hypothetical protein